MSETLQSTAPRSDPGWPSSWRTMPHGISAGRYTDPAFAALEYERLWGRVWQAAARLDEIPETGDYTVYNIGNQSVLLVRVDSATVKAYHNLGFPSARRPRVVWAGVSGEVEALAGLAAELGRRLAPLASRRRTPP